MNKKPFWKRVNRGAVVFAVLAVVVLAYVVATQLMLIPKKAELRALSDQVCALAEPYCTPDDALLQQLEAGKEPPKADLAALKEKLRPLFGEDTQYLDAAVSALWGPALWQADNSDLHVDSLILLNRYTVSCHVSEETAQIHMCYEYRGSGTFTNWETGLKENESDLDLDIVLSCRYEDGAWKLYRVHSVQLNTFAMWD